MLAQDFIRILKQNHIDFFTGVPDSLLNSFCFELSLSDDKPVIGVNEGACLAMAGGHYMATGDVPCVFMQNSGLGNIVNPFTSLAHEKVYAIPMLFVIGWRGEPGIKDEPQHIFMGEITLKLLELLGIEYRVIDAETDTKEVTDAVKAFRTSFNEGKSCAFVIKKGALKGGGQFSSLYPYDLVREDVIRYITSKLSPLDLVVSSTGKISRELFEVREQNGQPHNTDFLTVGSMGYASSIAMQLASDLPDRKVFCIDGDGAALMHLGAMATIGRRNLGNFIHIILDNEAHETVGGMPTVSDGIDWAGLSKSLGYRSAVVVKTKDDLNSLGPFIPGQLAVFKINQNSRGDLGRPTTTAKDNIDNFMKFIKRKDKAQ